MLVIADDEGLVSFSWVTSEFATLETPEDTSITGETIFPRMLFIKVTVDEDECEDDAEEKVGFETNPDLSFDCNVIV